MFKVTSQKTPTSEWNQEVSIIFKIDPGLRPKKHEEKKKKKYENFPNIVNLKIKIQEIGN